MLRTTHNLRRLLAFLLAATLSGLCLATGGVALAADNPKASVTARSLLEEKIRDSLIRKVDAFLGARVEANAYTTQVEIEIDEKAVAKLATSSATLAKKAFLDSLLSDPESETLAAKFAHASYADLRQFVKSARVSVLFGERLDAKQWEPWIDTLRKNIATGPDAPERVEGRGASLPISEREHLLVREARETRDRVLAEIRANEEAQRRLEDHKSRLRNSELERDKVQLQKDLDTERGTIKALSEQVNSERLSERMARDLPGLLKFFAAGGGIGVFVLLALIALGIGLVLAALGLGKRFIAASKEAGAALQSAFGGQDVKAVHTLGLGDDIAKQVADVKRALLTKPEGPDGEIGNIEPDLIAELERTVNELKNLVRRDIPTASAQITKLIEGGEQDKVLILFDMLGEEIAKMLFEAIHPKYQRDLKRYFYHVGPRSNPPPKLLYLMAVEVRSMLSATEILIRDDANRLFSQMLLTHSDAEIAGAMREMTEDKSSAMLAILPTPRVVSIMRNADSAVAVKWRRNMANAVKGQIPLFVDDIRRLDQIMNAPEKVSFQECTAYLKDLMGKLSEEECEDVIAGAEDDPKLKAAISGLRASMDDLWAQPLMIIQKLTANVELAPLAALFCEGSTEIRDKYLAEMTGRRRELLEDEFKSLQNEQTRRKAVRANAKTRRRVLDALADLADQGEAFLPFTRTEDKAKMAARGMAA